MTIEAAAGVGTPPIAELFEPSAETAIEGTDSLGMDNGAIDPGFSDMFVELVQQASARDQMAIDKADAFARGVHDDLHGTMIATKEAEISVKLVGSIRDKLMQSFQELWKINV